MDTRVYVYKKEAFRVETQNLMKEMVENIGVHSIRNIALYNVYDIFGADESDIKLLKTKILSDAVTDEVLSHLDLQDTLYIAYEYLPGQYDQRADAAQDCLMLFQDKQDIIVRSGKIVVIDGHVSQEDFIKIKRYLINPVEMREKDLSILELNQETSIEPIEILKGFGKFSDRDIEDFIRKERLAMSKEDLFYIQNYFKEEEKRDPSITEIKVLDTYWSDHCRHTTFETILQNIVFEKGKLTEKIQKAYDLFMHIHEQVKSAEYPITLMNMATVVGKYMYMKGTLDDIEVSDEVNACSIGICVDVDGVEEDWLLMFKNETHNHPTEIEPYGGASTCIGGSIRDPLSGRSYVYQAMRITGAADINQKMKDTIPNKLPQRVISREAAHGYSSYGNQIGLATTYVKEIFHPGYAAKRMEVGAVVGACPRANVVRAKPKPGDIVVLIGGKTGRDGIGGATGSSIEHNEVSLTKCSSEVQKGNAPMERRIQRLFRNPDCTRLIKKCNDFGAGGVSVAIGELADGVYIMLDHVPVKYEGLNATELAISESQERMACVIEEKHFSAFEQYAYEENIEATIVAKIIEEPRLIMVYKGQKVVDIARSFLNTNGVKTYQDVVIQDYTTAVKNPFAKDDACSILSNLQKENVASQRGLVEMFDASVGMSTVLMPFGGKFQYTEAEASVQKLPVFSKTNTVTAMTYGYHPDVSIYSPFLGGAYSVIEALAKLVATGCSYEHARLTCQEYFEKLHDHPGAWGKPMQALLGLIEAQMEFKTPAIGGKDSMSGTYKNYHVPPTLITFAITTEHVDNILSSELKEAGNYLYLVKHRMHDDYTPNYVCLRNNFTKVKELVDEKVIVSANTLKFGGLCEALAKMSFGNKIGIEVETKEDLYALSIGSMVVETNKKIRAENFIFLGKTISEATLQINHQVVRIDEAICAWEKRYAHAYPTITDSEAQAFSSPTFTRKRSLKASVLVDKPKVIIPVFPGTNCEYDCKKAFERAGAEVEIYVFKNIHADAIRTSLIELSDKIAKAQILMIAGGFSSGDEPDGSGKFIANVLCNKRIYKAIQTLRANDGLILGICNGFQALIKSGLLPYGEITKRKESSPTLYRNNLNRHVSRIVTTRVTSNMSPWLSSFEVADRHSIAISHGEGKFVINEADAKKLFENGQVATQYVDDEGNPTMNGQFNMNGSCYAIEGITSADGRIFGKMGHSERYEDGLFKNIYGEKMQNIFKNGVDYFKK